MDANEYQRQALSTANTDADIVNWILGLTGEVGEVANIAKKQLYHDKTPGSNAYLDELGDVLWYLSVLAYQLDLDLSDIMRYNLNKLAKRHPGGFKTYANRGDREDISKVDTEALLLRIGCDETKSGKTMWRCVMDDGATINIFERQVAQMPERLRNELQHMVFGGAIALAPGVPVTYATNERGYKVLTTLGIDCDNSFIMHIPNILDIDRQVAHMCMHKRAKALWETANKESGKRIVAFDTETTGLARDDVIVQIGVVDNGHNVVLEQLINPGKVLGSRMMKPVLGTKSASDVHGITYEALKSKPSWGMVAQAIKRAFEGAQLVAYNAAFDNKMLIQSGYDKPLNTICIMEMFAAYAGVWQKELQRWRWHSLEAACRALGIEPREAHDATQDAHMTISVLEAMAKGVEVDHAKL
jgi:DNA polymerase III epsilon subunit-like protein/NTP pyrophosphatase (non-canonical NTP hydrolase)